MMKKRPREQPKRKRASRRRLSINELKQLPKDQFVEELFKGTGVDPEFIEYLKTK